MPLDKLVEIPGIGEKTAEKVLATAQEYVDTHPPVAAESASPEEFTPEMEPTPEPAPEPAPVPDAPDASVTAPAVEASTEGEERG